MSPGGPAPSLAPSLSTYRRGVATKGDTAITNGHHHEKEARNPTVVPDSLLSKYHFTFLIRHPRSAVPSYYRCTVPPLSSITGFDTFDPAEAGYHELRLFFDYLRSSRQIGPGSKVDICVVDADDLLNNPTGTVEAYCRFIGMPFSQNMLKWNDEQNLAAQEAFEKWKGFHEDALNSKELKARTQVRFVCRCQKRHTNHVDRKRLQNQMSNSLPNGLKSLEPMAQRSSRRPYRKTLRIMSI